MDFVSMTRQYLIGFVVFGFFWWLGTLVMPASAFAFDIAILPFNMEAAWWVIAGLCAYGFLIQAFTIGDTSIDISRSDLVIGGIAISAYAGFFEELFYRYVFYHGVFIIMWALNGITFGLYGWIFHDILCSVANFFTLGMLENWFFHSGHWVIGAAILYTGIQFRDGHKYQGFIGWTNSWFLGMVFFWFMVNHGLMVAMFAHFLYNVTVFTTVALLAKQGYVPIMRRFK